MVTPGGGALYGGGDALAVTVRPGATEEAFDAVVLVEDGGDHALLRILGSYTDPVVERLPDDLQPAAGLEVPPVPVFHSDGAELGWLEARPPAEALLRTAIWAGPTPVPGAAIPLDTSDVAIGDRFDVALALQEWSGPTPERSGITIILAVELELSTGVTGNTVVVAAERAADGSLVIPNPRLEVLPG